MHCVYKFVFKFGLCTSFCVHALNAPDFLTLAGLGGFRRCPGVVGRHPGQRLASGSDDAEQCPLQTGTRNGADFGRVSGGSGEMPQELLPGRGSGAAAAPQTLRAGGGQSHEAQREIQRRRISLGQTQTATETPALGT